jgi:hypothetical protein
LLVSLQFTATLKKYLESQRFMLKRLIHRSKGILGSLVVLLMVQWLSPTVALAVSFNSAIVHRLGPSPVNFVPGHLVQAAIAPASPILADAPVADTSQVNAADAMAKAVAEAEKAAKKAEAKKIKAAEKAAKKAAKVEAKRLEAEQEAAEDAAKAAAKAAKKVAKLEAKKAKEAAKVEAEKAKEAAKAKTASRADAES